MKLPKRPCRKKIRHGEPDLFSQGIADALLGFPPHDEQEKAHGARRKYAPHGKLERLSEDQPWLLTQDERRRKRVELALHRDRRMGKNVVRKPGVLTVDDVLVLQDVVYRSTNDDTEGDHDDKDRKS